MMPLYLCWILREFLSTSLFGFEECSNSDPDHAFLLVRAAEPVFEDSRFMSTEQTERSFPNHHTEYSVMLTVVALW